MKNRLHDKKAGIAILISLIVLSLAEIVFRHFFLREMISSTANYAETLAVIGLALTILIFTLKGKDRLCYILYGAWMAYFVLDQLFELPSVLLDVIVLTRNGVGFIALSPAFHLVSMICIFVIGILLVEYMNDGTIYNRAFNLFCIITILATLGTIFVNVYNIVNGMPLEIMLAVFNNLYCIIMLFLFTFFAYDSARKQLNKVDFGSTK